MMIGWLQRFDIYRKVPKDLSESTPAGSITTWAAILISTLLFITELGLYLTPETYSHTFVDSFASDATMPIHVNITLPSLPCAIVSLDAQDIMGTHQVDLSGHSLYKQRLHSNGIPRMSVAPLLQSTISREQAKEQVGEGCRVEGSFHVKKVPGNFHISAHAHMDLLPVFFPKHSMNVSHIIHHLSFGPRIDELKGAKTAFAPLNTVSHIVEENHLQKSGAFGLPSFEYYIKVVPTVVQIQGEELRTYQFTANSNSVHYDFPVLYFRFDLSPITVQFTRNTKSFAHFLVQICAIVGGIVTVLGLLSPIVQGSIDRVYAKASIGKLG